MKLKTKRKNTVFIILFICIILLFLIPLLLLLVPKNKKVTYTINKQPAHIHARKITEISPSPSVAVISQNPHQRLLTKINTRSPLSASDAKVKNAILSSMPTSGIVYQTAAVTITYVKTFDFFQAEITTIKLTDAKDDATNWFRNQGMSQEGVCDLPLGFYLDSSIKNQLPDNGNSFNPLSDGC